MGLCGGSASHRWVSDFSDLRKAMHGAPDGCVRDVFRIRTARYARVSQQLKTSSANGHAIGDLLVSTGDDGTIRTWKKALNNQWMESAEIDLIKQKDSEAS